MTLALAAVVWRVVPADGQRGEAVGATLETAAAGGSRLRRTLRAPGPWLLAMGFAMYSSQWMAVVGFLPSVYTQAGVGPGAAGLLTALAAAANMVGNIGSGRLMHRGWHPRTLLLIAFAAMMTGALVAYSLPVPP
ncbi:MAG: hypothetical protein MO853_13770 [Candidatus Protistobacter heckmanni]|nr:hypothetical protein [Candidatus Protistobacter heckmanni]